VPGVGRMQSTLLRQRRRKVSANLPSWPVSPGDGSRGFPRLWRSKLPVNYQLALCYFQTFFRAAPNRGRNTASIGSGGLRARYPEGGQEDWSPVDKRGARGFDAGRFVEGAQCLENGVGLVEQLARGS
jgi:hypothetical protein